MDVVTLKNFPLNVDLKNPPQMQHFLIALQFRARVGIAPSRCQFKVMTLQALVEILKSLCNQEEHLIFLLDDKELGMDTMLTHAPEV